VLALTMAASANTTERRIIIRNQTPLQCMLGASATAIMAAAGKSHFLP
jgi:homoserine kinase